MSDVLRYYTTDELQALSLPELTALWELVPTDRQRRYKAVYDKEVKQAGAVGSDALEQRVTNELLTRYVTTALVPIGARWARTPTRIQGAAKTDAELVAPETVEQLAQPKKPPVKMLLAAGAVFMLMIFLVLPRLAGRGERNAANETLTSTATLTQTPGKSPTPTPIALEQQDPVIRGGDGDRTVAFPVNLRVSLSDTHQPRVFVVQRRVIQTAEWNFDSNPDTASYIAGLTVRPVIGIPYSAENEMLFRSMTEGTTFTLQMNTGATLQFAFEQRMEIPRSETSIFRQVEPSLVLVLIGERDEDGALTAVRTAITGTYVPDQELARDGALTGLLSVAVPTLIPTPIPTLPAQSRLDIQVISAETQAQRITIRLRIFNGQSDPVRITPDMIWLALGYEPEPIGPRIPAKGFTPFDLLPNQAVDLKLGWDWTIEPHAVLGIDQYQFALSIR